MSVYIYQAEWEDLDDGLQHRKAGQSGFGWVCVYGEDVVARIFSEEWFVEVNL